MSGKLNKYAYQELIDGNLAWLQRQPQTLERDHTMQVLRASVDLLYPSSALAHQPALERAAKVDHDFRMTAPEIVRIRNLGHANQWPKVWCRQLFELCDAYETLRALAAEGTEREEVEREWKFDRFVNRVDMAEGATVRAKTEEEALRKAKALFSDDYPPPTFKLRSPHPIAAQWDGAGRPDGLPGRRAEWHHNKWYWAGARNRRQSQPKPQGKAAPESPEGLLRECRIVLQARIDREDGLAHAGELDTIARIDAYLSALLPKER